MTSQFFQKYSWYLPVIPLAYLGLYFFLMSANGPFFLTRIDPDYVYLLNGMNCAVFNFDRIGHTDHPGTPFQLFIGLCINLGYLLTGKNGIVNDVLTRPEFYLAFTSHIMAILFAILIFWAGKIGQTQGRAGALLLQVSPFLSSVICDLSLRIMPDRFGLILTFLILIILVQILEEKNLNSSKQAMIIGFLTGLAIATKITFLPILFIPLLLLKKRFLFLTFLIIGFFGGVMPILGRLEDFRNLMDKIIHHDGIYGTGAEQMINAEILWNNLKLIASINLSTSICVILAATALTIKLWSNRRLDDDALFLAGYCLALTLAIMMVSKHFKNYYLAPAFVMSGVALFIVYKNWINQGLRYLITTFAIVFSAVSVNAQIQVSAIKRTEVSERKALEKELSETKMSSDYFIIKPEWLWGPSTEYGLIFGLSYVRHRDRYEDNIRQIYPKVLSFEGPERDLRSMRVYAVPDGEIENKSVLLADQEGRGAKEILSYLESRWDLINIDTLVLANDDLLIRVFTGDKVSQN